MTTINNTDPLENLLDKIHEKELDSRRREKYDRLIAAARRKNRLKKRWLAGIAAVTVAACFTVIIIITTSVGKSDNSELFESFYSPQEFPVEYRGVNPLNSNFLKAIRLYREGKADQAAKRLEPILAEDKNNPDYMLLMSQIMMQQKNFSSSIEYLNQVIKFGGSYERTGQWHLALSYLALNKHDRCAEILDSTIESGDPKLSKMARKLKRKIRL